MNNPGMDFEIWKQLRQKWTDLDAQGRKIKVDFQLVGHPSEKGNVLAIDVIQHIDGKPVTETVEREAGAAYAVLGIAGLSMERLVEVYKGMMKQIYNQANVQETVLDITMATTSPTSGELAGILVNINAPVQTPVQVNYQHYYVLKALRDRMVETTGDAWTEIRASYQPDALEFYFEY
jgi:hypothetical protein